MILETEFNWLNSHIAEIQLIGVGVQVVGFAAVIIILLNFHRINR